MARQWQFALAIGLILASGTTVRSQKETKEELIKKDLEALRGTWIAEGAERRGEALPQSFVDTFKTAFDGTTLTVYVGKTEIKSTITIDPTKKPKEIDMLTANKVNSPAIYSLEKDTLRVVLDAEDKVRAKGFVTEKEGTHMLFVLKRKKNCEASASGPRTQRNLTALRVPERPEHRVTNPRIGRSFGYWFDFGSDWWHQINVKASPTQLPGDNSLHRPGASVQVYRKMLREARRRKTTATTASTVQAPPIHQVGKYQA